MISITPETIAFLGAIVGGVSMSIAIYLQLMVKRACKPKWIATYLTGGVLLIMINIQAVTTTTELIIGVQMAAYLIILAIEIIGFVRILRRLDLSDEELPVVELLERM